MRTSKCEFYFLSENLHTYAFTNSKFVISARQESIKSEKINKELGKFWERSMEKYGDDVGSDEDNEVDEAELKRFVTRELLL